MKKETKIFITPLEVEIIKNFRTIVGATCSLHETCENCFWFNGEKDCMYHAMIKTIDVLEKNTYVSVC